MWTMARTMNSVFSPPLLRSSQSKSSRPNPASRSALPTCCRWVAVMKRFLSLISPNRSSMRQRFYPAAQRAQANVAQSAREVARRAVHRP